MNSLSIFGSGKIINKEVDTTVHDAADLSATHKNKKGVFVATVGAYFRFEEGDNSNDDIGNGSDEEHD